MTTEDSLGQAILELKKSGVSEPESSAVLLLSNVLGENMAYVYAHGEIELSAKQLKLFKKYIKRRKTHEPVWYIIGEVEFYGRKFKINNNVLTPRPETELLIQEVLEAINIKQLAINNMIELGTGSGIIAITLIKELKEIKSQKSKVKNESQNSKIIALDISEEALKVAKKNAKFYIVDKNIRFLQGDLLKPIKNLKFKIKNSIIVANLPYIPHEDMDSLQLDVLRHEPRIALDGGTMGTEIYEKLLLQMKELEFSGMAFFEIGIGQGKLITKIVQKYFPKAAVRIKKDLAGVDRIAIIRINDI